MKLDNFKVPQEQEKKTHALLSMKVTQYVLNTYSKQFCFRHENTKKKEEVVLLDEI